MTDENILPESAQEAPPEKQPEYFYIKVKNELREYEFRCPSGSPHVEILAALSQMYQWFEEEEKKRKTQSEEASASQNVQE